MSLTACCRIVGGPLERRQTEFRPHHEAAARIDVVLPCLAQTEESLMPFLFLFVVWTFLFVPGVLFAKESVSSGTETTPMVLIPAGPFPMGVPPGDRDGGRDEYPRHAGVLAAFNGWPTHPPH